MYPTRVPKYIRLEATEDLDPKIVKAWLNVVNEYGPDNITTSVPVVKPNGSPTHAYVIKSKIKNKRIYDIPLLRDLTEDEGQYIVDAWMAEQDGDYKIEISTEPVNPIYNEFKIIHPKMPKSDWRQICEMLSKEMHNRWVEEMVGKGWRYGLKMNEDQGTHPLLKNWDNLPEEYQKVDEETPARFLEAMDRMGYSVVNKNTLEKLTKTKS